MLGACAIMPLGAPIGSGIGIQNKTNITLIKEQSSVPVIVDAGMWNSFRCYYCYGIRM